MNMPASVARRTPAATLRRTISEIIEHIDAVEHAMAMFFSKGNHAELDRAREKYAVLHRHVDELRDLIDNAEAATADRVVEAAE